MNPPLLTAVFLPASGKQIPSAKPTRNSLSLSTLSTCCGAIYLSSLHAPSMHKLKSLSDFFTPGKVRHISSTLVFARVQIVLPRGSRSHPKHVRLPIVTSYDASFMIGFLHGLFRKWNNYCDFLRIHLTAVRLLGRVSTLSIVLASLRKMWIPNYRLLERKCNLVIQRGWLKNSVFILVVFLSATNYRWEMVDTTMVN